MNDNEKVTDEAELIYVVRCSESDEALTPSLTLINAEGLAEYFNDSHREGHCVASHYVEAVRP